LKIDIIKHPNETDGKSTAVHAKLLAPDDVTIYKYPCIPEYEEQRHEVRNSISITGPCAGEMRRYYLCFLVRWYCTLLGRSGRKTLFC